MEQVETNVNQNGAWFLVMYLFNIDTLIHPSIFNTHFYWAQGQGGLLFAIKKKSQHRPLSPKWCICDSNVVYLCSFIFWLLAFATNTISEFVISGFWAVSILLWFSLNHLQWLQRLSLHYLRHTERGRRDETRLLLAFILKNLLVRKQLETVQGYTVRLTFSPNYKDRQVPDAVRDYVSAPDPRPYIRHMPGCRSFFHSKGKAVSPSCYCRNEICFHPCHRIKISVSNYHYMVTHVGTMSKTRVLRWLIHCVAVMRSLLYHECQPSIAAPG